MEHTTYASRLRYLDADDVDDSVVDYDGLDVVGPDGERIGDVDGFIVDAQAGRVHYVVIDSGGWFRSRRFLIPVGHATVSSQQSSLRVDVTRAALFKYPEFDENRFREFSDDDLRVFEQRMSEACCPGGEDERLAPYGAQPHYTQPEWWAATSYPHERLRPVDTGVYHEHRRRFATAGGAASSEAPATVHDSGRPRRVAERAPVEDEPRQSER